MRAYLLNKTISRSIHNTTGLGILLLAIGICATAAHADEVDMLDHPISISGITDSNGAELFESSQWGFYLNNGYKITNSYLTGWNEPLPAYSTIRNNQVYFNGSRINVPNAGQDGFTDGTDVAILYFPPEGYSTPDVSEDGWRLAHYSFPVNIYVDGTYTLKLTTEGLANYIESTSNQSLPNKNKMLIIAFTETVGTHTMAIENLNGTNTVVVRDASGEMVPSAWMFFNNSFSGPASSSYNTDRGISMEKEIILPSSVKYLTIYAPSSLVLLSDLQLIASNAVCTGSESIKFDQQLDFASANGSNQVNYYDLNGRQILRPTSPGIYLRRYGTRIEKYLLR